MAYGTDGFLGITKQGSWGTATTSWHFVPFVSEGLNTNIETIMPASILDRYDEPNPLEGLQTVEGDIVMELNPLDCAPFLHAACGSSTTTITLSGAVYTHEFKLTQDRFDTNAALTPYGFQIYRGVEQAFQLTDGQANTLEIAITAGSIVQMTTGLICRTTSLMTKGTVSYFNSDAFTWDQASFSLSGAAVTDFEEIKISLNNALEGIVLLDGTKRRGKIQRNGYREIRVSGTIDLPDLNEYDIFMAQTEREMIATLKKTSAISSGYYEQLEIIIPSFRYEGFPVNIGGPGRVTVGFTGRGVYNSGSATTMKMTLVNTNANVL